MIDIQGKRAKQQIRANLIRQMVLLERNFTIEVRKILNREFRDAARFVRFGILEIDNAVNSQTSRMVNLFRKHYKRAGFVFSDRVFQESQKSFFQIETKAIETKTIEDDFWFEFENWAINEAARKIVTVGGIDWITKKIINRIVTKGMREGLSHQVIAKNILKNGVRTNPSRALKIARTETHTASEKAIHTAMDKTRLMKEKEWVSALDNRTRRKPFNHRARFPDGALGERVAMDVDFIGTSEALEYPGSSLGSAANIINCRCVALYFTQLGVQEVSER
jgi:hypothetical protein